MTSKRSDSAETLLKYLAYGMKSNEALAYFLVEDEDVSIEVLKDLNWTDSFSEGTIERAGRLLIGRTAEQYWQSVEEDIADPVTVLDPNPVAEILNSRRGIDLEEVNVDDESP